MSPSVLIINTGLDFIILGQAPKSLMPHDRNGSYQPPSTYRSHTRCHMIEMGHTNLQVHIDLIPDAK